MSSGRRRRRRGLRKKASKDESPIGPTRCPAYDSENVVTVRTREKRNVSCETVSCGGTVRMVRRRSLILRLLRVTWGQPHALHAGRFPRRRRCSGPDWSGSAARGVRGGACLSGRAAGPGCRPTRDHRRCMSVGSRRRRHPCAASRSGAMARSILAQDHGPARSDRPRPGDVRRTLGPPPGPIEGVRGIRQCGNTRPTAWEKARTDGIRTVKDACGGRGWRSGR